MLHSVTSLQGMVTAPHHLAAQAGLSVLRDGGNSVEAAVAVAATLAVVYPHLNGIGGDGFWLIAEPNGRTHSIDACGAAARSADLAFYGGMDAIPRRGPLAANTVAGAVSGWAAALADSNGTMPVARLLRDAILYAERGVPVTRSVADASIDDAEDLRAVAAGWPETFEPYGKSLRENDLLRQPLLAGTLTLLARDGLASFYEGPLARLIEADLKQVGSPLTGTDLRLHAATRPMPLSVRVSGATVFDTAPPSQGIMSLLTLAMFDRFETKTAEGFAHIHALVEATKQAFHVRDQHVGDPVHMTIDPQRYLDDRASLDEVAARIDPAAASRTQVAPVTGDACWFGVADRAGRVVSCVQSLSSTYGSGVVLPGTGILWHNRGSSFQLSEDSPDVLKPGRKPFHTAGAALARLDDGRVLAYGASGGDGQPQTQAAIFTRYVRYGITLQETITRPRWSIGAATVDGAVALRMEDRFPLDLYDRLHAAGHLLELVDPFDAMMGQAGAIVRHPSGVLEGASDPRSDGAVAAW